MPLIAESIGSTRNTMVEITQTSRFQILTALVIFSSCTLAMKENPMTSDPQVTTHNPGQGPLSFSPAETCDAVHVMGRLVAREAEERAKLQTVLENRILQLESEKTKTQIRISQLESESVNFSIAIKKRLSQLESTVVESRKVSDGCDEPRDCGDVKCCGNWKSGAYWLYKYGKQARRVLCDLEQDEYGWTVIQRRQDGSVDFNRNWTDYERGFGQLNGEFWLGLSTIHHLLSQRQYQLLVEMRNFTGGYARADYDWIFVSGPSEKYRLQIGRYTGTAGDALTYVNGMKFSTIDQDNDAWDSVHCAQTKLGAGWHNGCHYGHLNGVYCGLTAKNSNSSCISWYYWHNDFKPLQYSTMMVKPVASSPACPLRK